MIRLAAVVLLCSSPLAQIDRHPLIGVVEDPSGEPVVGAVVEAWRNDGAAWHDPAAEQRWTRIGSAPTADGGRFAIHVPAGLPCRLRVDHAPFALCIRDNAIPGVHARIELQAPAILEGQVSTRDGGAPVTATFSGQRRFQNFISDTEIPIGATDDQGRFRFDRMAPGLWRITVEPHGAVAPAAFEVTLESGEAVPRAIVVQRGVVLRGRVVDAETGRPISNAIVSRDRLRRRAVHTDSEGRYEMRGYGGLSALTTECSAPGYVKQVFKNEGVDLNELADPCVLDFRLERGHAFAGLILDPRGEPMPDVYVAAFGAAHDDGFHYQQWVAVNTDSEGKFESSGLRPDLTHVLVVRHDGFARLVFALPKAGDDGVRRVGPITMRAPRTVRGRVLDGNSAAVAGVRVVLSGLNTDRDRFVPQGPFATGGGLRGYGWASLVGVVGRCEVRSTADGGFAFGGVPAGGFRLEVFSEAGEQLGASDRIVVEDDSDPAQLILDARWPR